MSTMASHLSISTSTPSQTPAPTPAVAVAASEWIVYIEHYPRDSYKRDNTSKINPEFLPSKNYYLLEETKYITCKTLSLYIYKI